MPVFARIERLGPIKTISSQTQVSWLSTHPVSAITCSSVPPLGLADPMRPARYGLPEHPQPRFDMHLFIVSARSTERVRDTPDCLRTLVNRRTMAVTTAPYSVQNVAREEHIEHPRAAIHPWLNWWTTSKDDLGISNSNNKVQTLVSSHHTELIDPP